MTSEAVHRRAKGTIRRRRGWFVAHAPSIGGKVGPVLGKFETEWAARKALDKWLRAREEP